MADLQEDHNAMLGLDTLRARESKGRRRTASLGPSGAEGVGYAVDFAWARPSLAALAGAGFSGAVRYVYPGRDAKRVTRAEAEDIRGHGLALALVWETTAGRALDGYGAGALDCARAEPMADELGYPRGACIYYAVDTETSADSVVGYFEGIASTAGRPVGVYGSYDVVEGLADRGLARYLWQTVAWSYGNWSRRACLYQRSWFELPKVEGDYDENVILAADWGAWGQADPLGLRGRPYQVFAGDPRP